MRRDNISKRIRFIRSIKGISREALADATELSVSYLYQVESGKKNIGLSALIKVAESLEVSIDELVSGEERITAKGKYQILLEDLISDCPDAYSRWQGAGINIIIGSKPAGNANTLDAA